MSHFTNSIPVASCQTFLSLLFFILCTIVILSTCASKHALTRKHGDKMRFISGLYSESIDTQCNIFDAKYLQRDVVKWNEDGYTAITTSWYWLNIELDGKRLRLLSLMHVLMDLWVCVSSMTFVDITLCPNVWSWLI